MDFTGRNKAIDIIRALTMTLMIFVNDLWTIEYPKWLGHAGMNEDYLGLSDIVFPCFLFVVGMSIPYALENAFKKGRTGVQVASHILTRTLALIVMGIMLQNTGNIAPEVGIAKPVYKLLVLASFFLIWNIYPRTENKNRRLLYKVLKYVGVALLIFLIVIYVDPKGNLIRAGWWGILGLIGWTYLVCAFIYYFVRTDLKKLILMWAIFLVWSMLRCKLTASGEPLLNIPQNNALYTVTDQILNIGTGAHGALTMGGIILSVTELKLRDKKIPFVAFTTIVAAILALGGLITNNFWIISKIQATAPWVLYSSAIAVFLYGVIVWLVSKGKASWFKFIAPAGEATLTCYLVPTILGNIFMLFGISQIRPEWCHSGFLGILSCIIFSLVCVGLTWCMNKLYLKLKV